MPILNVTIPARIQENSSEYEYSYIGKNGVKEIFSTQFL
jgi:hypothetical protein